MCQVEVELPGLELIEDSDSSCHIQVWHFSSFYSGNDFILCTSLNLDAGLHSWRTLLSFSIEIWTHLNLLTANDTVCDKMLESHYHPRRAEVVLHCLWIYPKWLCFSGFVVEDEDSSFFGVDQRVTFSDIGSAVTDTTGPPSAAPAALIQSTPTFKVDLKVRSLRVFHLIIIHPCQHLKFTAFFRAWTRPFQLHPA